MSNSNFPTSLDTIANLPDPSSSDLLASPNPLLLHHYQHGVVNDALIAVENKLGITNSQDAATPSLDLRMRVREFADYTIIPSINDDEFNSTSLNMSSWSWVNQNTANWVMGRGAVTLTVPKGHTSDNLNAIVQPLPVGNSWKFETRVGIGGNNAISGLVAGGFVLYESTTGKLTFFNHYINGGSPTFSGTNWTNTSTYAGSVTLTAFGTALGTTPRFFQIASTATQYQFYLSYDGIYFSLVSVQNHSGIFTTAATHIGLCVDAYNLPASAGQGVSDSIGSASFDYFRRLA